MYIGVNCVFFVANKTDDDDGSLLLTLRNDNCFSFSFFDVEMN